MRVKRPGSPQPGRFPFARGLVLLAPALAALQPCRQAQMVGGKDVLEELPRRMFPTEAKRMRPRRRAVEIERLERRLAQIGAEDRRPRVGEDVKRTGRRIGGDG